MSCYKVCPLCNTIHTGQYGKYCPICANIHQDKIFTQEAKYNCPECGKPMIHAGICIVCQNLYPFGRPKKMRASDAS